MNKVKFFQSIHFKFVLIYILLIVVAMEIIGVYFINKLENQLETNFKNRYTTRSMCLNTVLKTC